MKKIRYILALMCLTLAPRLYGQVIEYHLQYGINKGYLQQIDSLRYIPAQDWNTSLAEQEYYRDDADQLHVVLSVTTGPNADRAYLVVSDNWLSDDDIMSGQLPGTIVIPPGTSQNYDIVLSGSMENGTAYLYAANEFYTQHTEVMGSSYWYDLNRKSVRLDFDNWLQNKDWTPLGTGFLRDDCITTFFGVPYEDFTVEIEENKHTPGYYRLVNPYTSSYPWNDPGDYDSSKNYYLYIHAEDPDAVYFEQTALGMDWGYGEFSIWSMADYYMVVGGYDLETVKNAGYCGTLKDGEITFPVQGILVSMADYDDGGWYYANGAGRFSILLPGYTRLDYSIKLSYESVQESASGETFAVGELMLGADAKNVLAMVYSREADPAAIADTLASGDIEGMSVAAGRIEVPFDCYTPGVNKLQLIVAVLVANENGMKCVKNYAAVNFEYEYYPDGNPWKLVGTGYFTDDIVTTMYIGGGGNAVSPPTYPVEIRQHEDYPGLYRIMNPWGKDVYPYAELFEPEELAPDGSYLEVNASDAEGVYIADQDLNMDWGDGPMGFVSWGARYLEVPDYSFDDVKNAGYLGTLKDGVITFPVFTTEDGLNYQGVLWLGNSGYYTGMNGKIEIVLPDAKYNGGMRAQQQTGIRRLHRTNLRLTFAQQKKSALSLSSEECQPKLMNRRLNKADRNRNKRIPVITPASVDEQIIRVDAHR